MIRPTAYERQLPMAELLDVARTELRRNDSITTYTFTGGVERRRIANPLERLARKLDEIRDVLASLVGFDLPQLDWPEHGSGYSASVDSSPYTLASAPLTTRNLWGGHR